MSSVAIVSGVFSSGGEIARKVAEKMEYRLVGEDLIEETAKRYDTSVKKLTRALAGDRTLFNRVTHDYEKSVIYIKAVLAEWLTKDDLVCHGAAAQLIPRTIDHVLKVVVVAGQNYRLKQAGADARIIKESDKGLTDWTRELYGTGPWDPALYDIKIPLPDTSVDQAVDLIVSNLTKDALRPTDRSIRAVLDFQLAARVHLALLEGELYDSQVEVDQGKVQVTLLSQSTPSGRLARTMQALRLDSQEELAQKICRGIEGVKDVEVAPGKRPPRTLLVDDEQDFVLTLSERLQMRDIQSEVAFDGEKALDYLKSDQPEVMVLDLRMPGMDGLEVLKRVKRDHPDIEVIVVTGHGTDKDEQAARQLGAFDYLQKPVDINTLEERIQAASAKAKSRQGDAEKDQT
jgi:CheY-like chemotaxis protein